MGNENDNIKSRCWIDLQRLFILDMYIMVNCRVILLPKEKGRG